VDLSHYVRNVKEKNLRLFKFRCNIFICVRIIKEMPGSVASGTPCSITFLCFVGRASRCGCVKKNQLDAQLILSILRQPLHVSGASRPIIRMYNHMYTTFFFSLWRCDPTRAMASSFLRFLDHTQRRTTVGRTPLDE
jgi:hypothetical protein